MVKEGSSDYKKVKRCSLKNLWLNGSLWNQKWFFYGIAWSTFIFKSVLALFHCMVRHGTVRYGSLLGGFPLGTVPGTWYFFSTTSVEVPSSRTVTKTWRVNSADHWMAGEKSSLLRHWTCDTRPSSTALPARFKSAQPAKDRTQLLFKQTHIFASTTK